MHFAAAILSVLAMAMPAAATTDTTFVPNTPLTDVYFLCDGETKEGTLNATKNSQYPTWDTTKPTASVQSGAGCGQVDEFALSGIRPETPFEFTAKGYYTGNIDSLTFRMNNIFVGGGRNGAASTLNIRVLVDGVSMFGNASTTNAAGAVSYEPSPRKVVIKPVMTGATGAVGLYEATVRGIDLLTEDQNIEHEVVFNVTSTEPLNLWAWGNAEAPSGITFNPSTPAAVKTLAVSHAKRATP